MKKEDNNPYVLKRTGSRSIQVFYRDYKSICRMNGVTKHKWRKLLAQPGVIGNDTFLKLPPGKRSQRALDQMLSGKNTIQGPGGVKYRNK